jgi:hypothetical protein
MTDSQGFLDMLLYMFTEILAHILRHSELV